MYAIATPHAVPVAAGITEASSVPLSDADDETPLPRMMCPEQARALFDELEARIVNLSFLTTRA